MEKRIRLRMKRSVLLTAFFIGISIAPKAQAAEKLAASSAQLITSTVCTQGLSDTRVIALQRVLKKYHSQLFLYAPQFVASADKYGVDWQLLPSISGTESGFGAAYIHGTHNAYGWGGGRTAFLSWEDGIDTINKALRKKYIDKGADTVEKISFIYASSNRWPGSVNSFIHELNKEYVSAKFDDLTVTL